MHKITKPDGSFLTVEKFNYIRRHKNGSLVICEKKDAEGVAHGGTPYLFADGCNIHEVDGGLTIDEMATQLAIVDETAIELFEANLAQEDINVAQDDALIELYEMIGG